MHNTRIIKNENILINYKYYTDNTKYNQYNISLQLEISRYKIIQKLTNIFKSHIIKFKKSINIQKLLTHNKLNEYIQRWCWLQYDNNTLKDIVIPYVKNEQYNFQDLVEFINYNLKSNISIDNPIIINLIKNVKLYLKNSYENLYNNNDTYRVFKFENNNYIILIISNNLNNANEIKKNDSDKKFSQYKITIHVDVYNRLVQKFYMINKNYNMVDNYIFCLIYRYSYIDSGNQQLAIHKKIKELFKIHGVDFELYGSAINALSNHYCSLFYDIEKYFGSHGNFFDINIKNGIYWCNPPYDDTIMTNTAKKILNILTTNINICFIVTIPIWDMKTQNSMSNIKYVTKDYNINSNPIDHNDYKIYALLKPYIKSELIIPKFRIPYFNFRLNKPIYAVDTYMLLIYHNTKSKYTNKLHFTFDKIIEMDKNNYFVL